MRPDVFILAIAMDEKSDTRLKRLIQKMNLSYSVIAKNDDVVTTFKPHVFPTNLLFDPDGNQVLMKEGPITQNDIIDRISNQKK